MAKTLGKEFRGRDRARLSKLWNAILSIIKMDEEREAINVKKGTKYAFFNNNDEVNSAIAKVQDRLGWAFSKKR